MRVWKRRQMKNTVITGDGILHGCRIVFERQHGELYAAAILFHIQQSCTSALTFCSISQENILEDFWSSDSVGQRKTEENGRFLRGKIIGRNGILTQQVLGKDDAVVNA